MAGDLDVLSQTSRSTLVCQQLCQSTSSKSTFSQARGTLTCTPRVYSIAHESDLCGSCLSPTGFHGDILQLPCPWCGPCGSADPSWLEALLPTAVPTHGFSLSQPFLPSLNLSLLCLRCAFESCHFPSGRTAS